MNILLTCHDCYVLMKCLLFIIKVNSHFKDLCSTTLKEDNLNRMEQNIPIILYNLKIIFLQKFFNFVTFLIP